MTEQQETVLLGWARDADGAAQRFTGVDIYTRVGVWCMQRLRRDTPTVATYYCRVGGHYFTISIAMVPERAIPRGRPAPAPRRGRYPGRGGRRPLDSAGLQDSRG